MKMVEANTPFLLMEVSVHKDKLVMVVLRLHVHLESIVGIKDSLSHQVIVKQDISVIVEQNIES